MTTIRLFGNTNDCAGRLLHNIRQRSGCLVTQDSNEPSSVRPKPKSISNSIQLNQTHAHTDTTDCKPNIHSYKLIKQLVEMLFMIIRYKVENMYPIKAVEWSVWSSSCTNCSNPTESLTYTGPGMKPISRPTWCNISNKDDDKTNSSSFNTKLLNW